MNKNNNSKSDQDENHTSKSLNLKGFDGSVSLDELFEIRKVIHDRLEEYIGGVSIEGNGANFNFTFKGKPFFLRVEKDDFHWEYWKEKRMGYWSEDS